MSHPLKAWKLEPKPVPEKSYQKVFDEVAVLEPEPVRLPEKISESVPERPTEKVLKPKKGMKEIPKLEPEELPEKVPEKPREEKVPEEAVPKRKPVKVPQKVVKEALITEKQTSVSTEEFKVELISKKQTEMISAEKTVHVKAPDKIPDTVSKAKPKQEVEEILPKGTADFSCFCLSLYLHHACLSSHEDCQDLN